MYFQSVIGRKYLVSPWRTGCLLQGRDGADRALRTAEMLPVLLPTLPGCSPLSPPAALSQAALCLPVPPLLTADPCNSIDRLTHDACRTYLTDQRDIKPGTVSD